MGVQYYTVFIVSAFLYFPLSVNEENTSGNRPYTLSSIMSLKRDKKRKPKERVYVKWILNTIPDVFFKMD